MLIEYWGSSLPPNLVSSTNKVLIYFYSDDIPNYNQYGFKLVYNPHGTSGVQPTTTTAMTSSTPTFPSTSTKITSTITTSSVTLINKTSVRDNSPPLGCYETTRKIVLQLKMIEWGIYGLGDGTAGMFLANHYSTLGPYFGDKFGHDWPHSPLLKEPSKLELAFHQQMTQITEELTNGKLKNVSILDFAAFGSMIGQINTNYKMKSNWPTEMNFEALKGINDNPQEMFTLYKNILDDWKNYLIKVRQKDPQAHFSAIMENNTILNFTKYIRDDMKSFLMSIQASHLNPRTDSSPIWKNIAHRVFKSNNKDAFVSDRGIYDKLIMTCSMRRNLLTKTNFYHEEGCDLFHPTLTTKGFCYTFNGNTPYKIWKTAEIINVFNDLFPAHHSNEQFYGPVKEQGDIFLHITKLNAWR